jgi:hypothetical protein
MNSPLRWFRPTDLHVFVAMEVEMRKHACSRVLITTARKPLKSHGRPLVASAPCNKT